MILKKDLLALNKDIKALGKKVDMLLKAADKSKAAKSANMVSAKKVTKSLSATDQVLRVIQRSKKGVGVPILKEKTGFNDKKVRNIIYKAFSGGKIKRAGRGLYIGVETEVPKASKTKAVKIKPAVKAPAKKGAAKLTATDQVLKIVNTSKKGVDIITIKKKTGFEDKKLRNIIFRANKEGKIKREDRGVYIGVK